MNKGAVATTTVAVFLSFGVGLLIGKTACSEKEIHREYMAPPPPRCPELPERECCECPPELEYDVEPEKDVQKPAKPTNKPLPDESSDDNTLRRKRLLAWVRDRSSSLSGCNETSAKTSRMNVTISVSKERQFKRVDVDAPSSEISVSTRSCIKNEIKKWNPPEELMAGEEKLVFGLTL